MIVFLTSWLQKHSVQYYHTYQYITIYCEHEDTILEKGNKTYKTAVR